MELALPQHPAQVPQHAVGQDDLLHGHAAGGLHRPQQPLVVRHGVRQGGLGQLHGQEAQVAGEGEARLHELPAEIVEDSHLLRGAQVRHLHAVAVGGGDVRHLDLRVAADLGQAGQAPAGGVLLGGDVAVDGGVQVAGGQTDPALSAHPVAGAGSVDGHVGLPCHVQQLLPGVGGDDHRVPALDDEFNGKHSGSFPVCMKNESILPVLVYRAVRGLSRNPRQAAGTVRQEAFPL